MHGTKATSHGLVEVSGPWRLVLCKRNKPDDYEAVLSVFIRILHRRSLAVNLREKRVSHLEVPLLRMLNAG